MAKVTQGVPASVANQGARHILYVEGEKRSLDVEVLEIVIPPSVRVEQLGASANLRGAVRAFHKTHPEWWFIIDRDNQSEEMVEKTWDSFPNPAEHNLLIWRKNEIESYFLDPDWLVRSRFLRAGVTASDIREVIVQKAIERIWYAALCAAVSCVNFEVRKVRLKGPKAGDLLSLGKDDALNRYLNDVEIESVTEKVSDVAYKEKLIQIYEYICSKYLGDATTPTWNTGEWLNLMPSNEIFRQIISQFFRVPDRDNPEQHLSGERAAKAVVIDLLKNHDSGTPDDFRELSTLLEAAMSR